MRIAGRYCSGIYSIYGRRLKCQHFVIVCRFFTTGETFLFLDGMTSSVSVCVRVSFFLSEKEHVENVVKLNATINGSES